MVTHLRRLLPLALACMILAAGCSSSAEVEIADVGDADSVPADVGNDMADDDMADTSDMADTGDTADDDTADDDMADDDMTDDDMADTSDMTDDDMADTSDESSLVRSGPLKDLSDDELSCVFERLSDNPALARTVDGAPDIDTLPVEEQAEVLALAVGCAPDAVAASMAASAGSDRIGPEATTCLTETITSNPDNRDLYIGLAALGASTAIPDTSQPLIVDMFVTCIPASTFSEQIIAEMDPLMAGALDADCLSTNLTDDTIRPMWEAAAADPNFNFDEMGSAQQPLLDALFGCVSFGQVIAQTFSDGGVDLSGDTITCIDDGMSSFSIDEILNDDPEAQAAFEVLIQDCLTAEEVAAMEAAGG